MLITNHHAFQRANLIFAMDKQHYLTREEKVMVVRTHRYLSLVDARDRAAREGRLRLRVGKCLGIGERTVDRVLAEFRENGGDFSIAPSPALRGRPPLSYDDNLITIVRGIINQKNLSSQPTSVRDIFDAIPQSLSEGIGSERTLHRLLQRSGFYFGKGKKSNALVETEAIQSLRAKYLREKLSNRDANGLPIVPELFLDESYCHKNHTKPSTWIDSSMPSNFVPSGKGPRAVIIGAGVLRAGEGKLVGSFVCESVRIWEASAAEKEDDDYHGNFNADLFETWFEELCYFAMMEFGSVRIHMDGAKYHLRNLNPVPTTAWRKHEIQEWLTQHEVSWDQAMLKAELLALAKQLNLPKDYACVHIAANYGHFVLITPPYHPELQPIEIIWAVVKNAVAMGPPRPMNELIYLLWQLFDELVTSKTWEGAYRKAQGFEDEFWAAQLAKEDQDEEDSDDSESECEATVTYSF